MVTKRNSLISVSDEGLHDWERDTLRDLNVVGIDHDGPYDSIIANRLDTDREEWPASCDFSKESGTAGLIAVMEDGSRVRIPAPKPVGGYDDNDVRKPLCDDATTIIMAMMDGDDAFNSVLTALRPEALDEFMSRIGSDMDNRGGKPVHARLHVLDNALSYIRERFSLNDFPKPLFRWSLFFCIDMFNDGFRTTPGNAFMLAAFLRNSDGFDRSLIPEFVQERLKGLINQKWSEKGMRSRTLEDFKGNDRMAWAIVDHAMMLPRHRYSKRGEYTDFDTNSDGNILSRLLTSGYVDREAISRINAMLDDSDWPGLSTFVGMLDVFLNGATHLNVNVREKDGIGFLHGSWNRLLALLDRAKSCNWEVLPLIVGLVHDNAQMAADTSVALLEAVMKYKKQYNLKERPGYDSSVNGMLVYVVSPRSLDGARLLRTSDLSAPDSEYGLMNLVYGIMAEHNGSFPLYDEMVVRRRSALNLSTLLEDISIVHDAGISVADLDGALRKFMTAFVKANHYDPEADDIGRYDPQLAFIHWIANRRPDFIDKPYSFYSALPDYHDCVEEELEA